MRRLVRWFAISLVSVAASLSGVGLAIPAVAQTTVVVEGRVLDPSGTGIQNATVALEGIGFRLTDEQGAFRFGAVPSRTYVLRVDGFGYEAIALSVEAERDIDIDVGLELAPLVLDSLVVESRTVEIEGRVWDPVRDRPIPAAEVISNQADPERTSWGGRFKIKVGEGVPVRLSIRAFRYLPLDTLVVPELDGEYRFELEEDPLTARMIEVEVARLDERAGGLRAVTMSPLNYEELQRWRGATLRELLKARFPVRRRRIQCVILDERDVGGPMLEPTLDITLADDLDRVEFLFRGAMMRIYTKEFMRKMLGSGIPLRRPAYSDMARPPLCL